MAYCMRRTALPVCLLLTLFHSTTVAEQVWSPWYNSNPGHEGTVENETLDRIATTHTLPCPREGIVAVQCRVAGSNATFSGQFRHGDNVLHVPCNLTGLLCRNHDQILAGTAPCRDYELRVLCLIEDEARHPHNTKDNEDGVDDMGVKGGFTAMVAGGSVVIPLACVLVFQLRRYKREERQRQQQARQAAEDSARGDGASGNSGAPPTYEDLFGHSGSVAVISSGALEATASETETSPNVTERLLAAPSPERLEGRVNPGASLDVTASSGTSPSSSPVSSASSSVPAGGHGSSRPVQARSGSTSSEASSTASSSMSSASDRRMSLVSSSTSSSTTSTDVFLPPTPSGRDVIHRGPPPAYDWPGPAHVTIVMPGGESGVPSDLPASGPPPPSSAPGVVMTAQPRSSEVVVSRGRRFLGMHLSIFDLMAAIYPDPAAASTPPPSYDDALKILEASKQPQVPVT